MSHKIGGASSRAFVRTGLGCAVSVEVRASSDPVTLNLLIPLLSVGLLPRLPVRLLKEVRITGPDV